MCFWKQLISKLFTFNKLHVLTFIIPCWSSLWGLHSFSDSLYNLSYHWGFPNAGISNNKNFRKYIWLRFWWSKISFINDHLFFLSLFLFFSLNSLLFSQFIGNLFLLKSFCCLKFLLLFLNLLLDFNFELFLLFGLFFFCLFYNLRLFFNRLLQLLFFFNLGLIPWGRCLFQLNSLLFFTLHCPFLFFILLFLSLQLSLRYHWWSSIYWHLNFFRWGDLLFFLFLGRFLTNLRLFRGFFENNDRVGRELWLLLLLLSLNW